MALPTKPDETPTLIFNPSKEDFIYPFSGVDHTLPSRQIVTHPKYLADHLAKHLASKLALAEGPGLHYEDRYKRQLEKIYVTL